MLLCKILNVFQLTYKPFGRRSILVEWPPEISENILQDVLKFKLNIQNKYIKSNIYITSAYNSILITYDTTIDNINNEILSLKSLYSSIKHTRTSTSFLWKIPVCYDDEFAWDLDVLSIEKRLSKSKIIELHSDTIYTVYFIGFLPGFLYLGDLDKSLHFPRKSSPRQLIKKGAVAIGGNQTGIYPNESPGGWNIIGNSPISFFDASKDNPCFAKAGDKIQFVPIGVIEYQNIFNLVKEGVYQIESEVIDG